MSVPYRAHVDNGSSVGTASGPIIVVALVLMLRLYNISLESSLSQAANRICGYPGSCYRSDPCQCFDLYEQALGEGRKLLFWRIRRDASAPHQHPPRSE